MIVLVNNGVVVSRYSGEVAEILERDLYVDGIKMALGIGSQATAHSVPDQALDLHSIDHTSEPIRWPDDVIQYDTQASMDRIDFVTGQAISKAVHPLAGTDESIGTIRDMVAQIINAIGLEPTDDFACLNKIAIAEIEEGRVKKEKL